MRYGVRYGREDSVGDAFAEFASKRDALMFLRAISKSEPGVHFTVFDVNTNEVVS